MTRRILLVEDERDVARVLELGLGRLVPGVEIHRAGHGAEALERVRRAPEPYDLLVCDIMMPVMDGSRLLAALEAEGLDTARVLVLSAVDPSQLDEVLGRPEVVGFLQKPVDLVALAGQVQEILAGS